MRTSVGQIAIISRAQIESLEPRQLLSVAAPATPVATAGQLPPRLMEYLDRGVVATRISSSSVFVSWRSLALDPAGLEFNIYRSVNGATASKLNSSQLSAGTNYTDTSASNAAAAYTYFVRPVLNGAEQAASPTFTVPPNTASGPLYSIPLRNIGTYSILHISVADLDGDGAYDFVVDRRPPSVNEVATQPDIIEAYKSDGTFLWSVDCGFNSYDQDNIEPGSSAIDIGNWDGVCVYDFDGDGKAEVAYRSANGVVFGDGSVLNFPANNDVQFISMLDGATGSERARIQVPGDYLSDGPMAAMMGVGYLDGVRPSLVVKFKNRIGSGDFNEMIVAYNYRGTLTQKWKWLRGSTAASDGHNLRIADVDGDGQDEVCEIGFVLESDGTLKYSLASQGIIHGDRFYIGDFDPSHPGLEGYGIQQNNPSMLMEYYYDAATGQILNRVYGTSVGDAGRGDIGDIDPAYPGAEYWSFNGLHTVSQTAAIGTATPWPHLGLYWDGDLQIERLSTDSPVVDQWNPASQSTSRVTTLYHYGSPSSTEVYFGDIIGDWREEAVYERSDHLALDIFTTQIPTTTRLYTLAENPLYRNNMTLKGYLQTRTLDYYLGEGMTTPPTPNIAYVGTVPPPTDVIYQAEDAAYGGGSTVDSDRAGYNGSGFINFSSSGGYLQFDNINGGSGDGSARIVFRYALGAAGSRTGKLIINGIEQNITFNSTGGWTNWQLLPLDIRLNANTSNTIRIESNGQDLANVDELQVFVAPVITQSNFNFTAHPNTLTFHFNEDVSASLSLDDLVVSRIGGGTVVPMAMQYLNDTATFTLPASLADGNYRATFIGGGVADAGGAALSSNFSFDFFVLAGDANRDRVVDATDLGIVSLHWASQSGNTFSTGDFNYDGRVDVGDLLILANNWQEKLDPPLAAPLPTSTTVPLATTTPPVPTPVRRSAPPARMVQRIGF